MKMGCTTKTKPAIKSALLNTFMSTGCRCSKGFGDPALNAAAVWSTCTYQICIDENNLFMDGVKQIQLHALIYFGELCIYT